MNLLEAINHIQDSTNFKKWFGKSIFHDNGVPHVFYHGTSSDISAFSHDHIGKGTDQFGAGFYFTNSPEVAHHYTNKSGDETGGNIMPVHLRVEKPIRTNDEKPFTPLHIQKIITSAPNHRESLQNFGDTSYEGYHKVLQSAVNAYSDIPKHQAMHDLSNDFYGDNHSQFLKNLTTHTGYDAVIDAHPAAEGRITVNVFHPNQIKSAIGNNEGSAFSKKSDKIIESMDSPLPTTKVPEDSMLHTMGAMSAAMVGGDNFAMHKLQGSGYMIQFDKDGATELHHVDDDLQAGYIKGRQPSIRMISAYRKHIKDLVDSGKTVRIVAHNNLADAFHGIAKRLVDRNPEYQLSKPLNTEHEITGDKLKSWTITK